MKELSIEQKAKAYDELFIKAKQIYNKENDVLIMHTIEDLFPEVKEPEDERIRQKVIKLVKMSNAVGGYALHKWEADEMLAWLEKQGEQKSDGWNEKDEENVNNVLYIFNQLKDASSYEEDNIAEKTINWLKSLKDRIQPQPKQEWSEEDVKQLRSVLSSVKHVLTKANKEWLESLRPQNRWKPSDEQMMALLYHCSNGSVLSSLYNDLKKLKDS